MPLQFDKLGIRFLYPDNWQLSEESTDAAWISVSVSSPGGGYWQVQRHGATVSLESVANQALKAMREVYPEMEADPADEELESVPAEGFDLHFFCLDLLISARIRAFHQGSHTFLLMWQAESREFDDLLPVFQAITKSLLDA